MAIIFPLLIVLILLTSWFDNPDGELSKYHLVIAISAVYFIVSLFNYLRNPYFIFFSDGGEMLILRYYPLSIFNHKKNSIEIPKTQFLKFEINKFFFGMEEKLIVYQNYRNKIAKYPPISLSALSKKDRERILAALQNYMK
jgi:hypothetical protein